MEKKLLVISIDSFITEDLEIMKTLPNFSRVLGEASVVKRNLTTYPTLTHSIHTTIQTGLPAGKTRRCEQRVVPALFQNASALV